MHTYLLFSVIWDIKVNKIYGLVGTDVPQEHKENTPK